MIVRVYEYTEDKVILAKRQVWFWFVSTSTKSAYKWRVSVGGHSTDNILCDALQIYSYWYALQKMWNVCSEFTMTTPMDSWAVALGLSGSIRSTLQLLKRAHMYCIHECVHTYMYIWVFVYVYVCVYISAFSWEGSYWNNKKDKRSDLPSAVRTVCQAPKGTLVPKSRNPKRNGTEYSEPKKEPNHTRSVKSVT